MCFGKRLPGREFAGDDGLFELFGEQFRERLKALLRARRTASQHQRAPPAGFSSDLSAGRRRQSRAKASCTFCSWLLTVNK